MIVFLLVQGFYVRHRVLPERPFLLVRDKVILDASPLALERGVEVGMTLRQARSIVFDGVFEEYNPDEYEAAQREWLDACCEFTDVVEPIDQHTAYVDLSAHPDPLDILGLLVKRLKAVTGCSIRYGIGRTKWVAPLALSRGVDAYAHPRSFINALTVYELTPVKPEQRERLDRLGYRLVEQVAAIPLKVLQNQFGEDATTIYQAARGGCIEPIKAAYPEGCILARYVFREATDALEAFDLAIRRLAEKLSDKLRQDDLQGSDMTLYIIKEEAEGNACLKRHFAKALQSRASVQFALKRMVEEYLKPEEEAPEFVNRWTGLRVQMPNLGHAVRKQANLYTWQATDQRNAAEQTIDQLHRTFGIDAVQLAADVIEPRHKRVLKVWKDALGWV